MLVIGIILAVIIVFIVVMVVIQLPELRRYMKIRSM